MNFFAPSRILIIYGGTDSERNVNYYAAYYTHIGVLDLKKMVWINVNILGEPQPPRCSHQSIFIGTKLVLFGGINQKGFVNGGVKYIEVN